MKLIFLSVLLGTAMIRANGGEPEKPAESKSPEISEELHPTGLTIVLMDSANKVIDTVKIPDDKGFYDITFTVADGLELKAFGIGPRIDKAVPKNVFIKGTSKASGGNGRLVANVEEGMLVGVTGNGFGTLTLTTAITDAVAKDLKEDKPAEITLVEELVDDELEDE